MKYILLEYETVLKQLVLNRLYFDTKKEICDYLKISNNQLENFFNGKIKGKRKSISILQRVDIFRRYDYNSKSIEKVLHTGLEDLEDMFRDFDIKKIE